jgi:catechol 2,3-dioxygenase-like lactoylglutathione lyase family enzyme
MRITASAVSLNVSDPAASAEFAERRLGFRREMEADGFVSLSRDDAGFNLIFLRTGLGTYKPEWMRGRSADGVLVVFVVVDVDSQYQRLRRDGVEIATPLQTEPWGERFFQITDPNGIVFQFVQWVEAGASGE